MDAFPPDFDPRTLPAFEQREREPEQPKKTSWWFVFEQWVSAPSSEEEFVLA
jgi:hypothetical protein